MRQHLNDMVISNLKSGPTYIVWDAGLPTFGIRVGRRAKTFVLKQQNRYYVLGRYPIVGLKQARDEAKRRIALKYFPQQSVNASDAVRLYLEDQNLRASSQALYRRTLENHFPKKQLAAITIHDLTTALKRLPTSHANLAHSVFKAFLNWSLQRGHIERNPLAGLKKHKTQTRDRVLSDDELQIIYFASPPLVKLLIHTGQRRGETAAIQPAWISPDSITFPKEITKNKQQHTIPTTPAIRALLMHVPFILAHWSDFKRNLDEITGPMAHWTLHDLRRTFATNLARLKVQPHVAERILNHKTGELTPMARIYNRHKYFEEMHQALLAHDAWLATLMQAP